MQVVPITLQSHKLYPSEAYVTVKRKRHRWRHFLDGGDVKPCQRFIMRTPGLVNYNVGSSACPTGFGTSCSKNHRQGTSAEIIIRAIACASPDLQAPIIPSSMINSGIRLAGMFSQYISRDREPRGKAGLHTQIYFNAVLRVVTSQILR